MKSTWTKRGGLISWCILLSTLLPLTPLWAVDTDNDGIADDVEIANGYNPNLTTRIIYVDATRANDNGDGLSLTTAKRSIKAGVNAAKVSNVENVVIVLPGTYSGADNRDISFGGYNIKLRSQQGAAQTIVDLQRQGRFLYLHNGEGKADSWLDGFTVKNGYSNDGGAVYLESSACLTIKNCVFDGNKAEYSGGAVAVGYNSNIDVYNTKFFNNNCPSDGETWWEECGGGAIGFGYSNNNNISGCVFANNYSFGGGAIHIVGGALTISSSTFRNNVAYDGGAIAAEYYDLTLAITNCLIIDNRARYSGAINCGYGYESTVTITNSTIAGTKSGNGVDINIGDSAFNLHNSILVGTYGGTPSSIQYSRTTQNSSGYGNGNITGDPQLTPQGVLKSTSPCIDAGSSSYAPATDIAGQSRPVGSAPDMGCYEFLDSDSDGIPDSIEIAAGMNPNNAADASGDADNDGISNLQEFLNGTDPGNADTDGDGITDNVEITNGYDPLNYTKMVYVDAVNGSDSQNGATQATAKKTISSALAQFETDVLENVLLLMPGIYTGADNRDLYLSGNNLKIRSQTGADNTVIDLSGVARFIQFDNCGENVLIDGVTICNGSADYGAAIRADGTSIVVRNSVFRDNSASEKGAIYAHHVPARVENCIFKNNTARHGAALAIYGDGNGVNLSTVSSSTFIGNYASGCGGAINIDDAPSISISSSRFLHNYAGDVGGSIGFTSRGNLNIVNTLFGNNRARNQYSDIYGDRSEQRITLTNVTIFSNDRNTNKKIRIEGTPVINNSIILGAVDFNNDRPLTANYNCSTENWSSRGTGNITSDPQLTKGGFLKSGSPCINAGSTALAPATDIFGSTRPAGNSADIGCQEFQDSDNDGIPDAVEIAAGLNPASAADATGDLDGDGVSNINEYLLGSDITQADSDSDGINDGAEVAAGYNPQLFTKVIYVDSSKADDYGNGASAATAKKSIRGALNITHCGENIILVAPGTYTGNDNKNLNFSGRVVKIRSTGNATNTIIDLENSGRFLNLEGREPETCLLEGVTIKNGSADYGSAIRLGNSDLKIKNCVFEKNTASSRGAVFAENGSLVNIEGCSFNANVADHGAAITLHSSQTQAIISQSILRANRSESSGGAIFIDDASAVVKTSRILSNQAGGQGGAVFMAGDNSRLEIENSLLGGNWSRDNYSDISGERQSQYYKLVNVTIFDGVAAQGNSCRFDGDATLINCIVQGHVHYRENHLTATSNCTSDDWRSIGSGNISSSPQLTTAGYLKGGSPCINAGTANGAPSEDIDGVARPWGNGIDIGCQEFKDSDGDGIPDNVEVAAGLNPNNASDAVLDKDGDGINNLDEYHNGSAINNTDSDGDGISDAAEAAMGYDPNKYTGIVYVDGINGSDANNGSTPALAKKTIGAGIVAARSLDNENIVMVAAGTYTGNGNKNLDFGGYNIKLRSISGASSTIIDLEGNGRFLYLHNHESMDSWLDGFTIKNGYMSEFGTAVHLLDAGMDIRNCVFENNRSGIKETWEWEDEWSETYWYDADSSAAIYAYRGPIRISDTVFRDNFSRNDDYGSNSGAIKLACVRDSYINNCSFIGNQGSNGGALTVSQAQLEINNCRFIGNRSFYQGGAISWGYDWYYDDDDSVNELTLKNCLFLNNSAADNYSDINMEEDGLLNLYNTTMSGGYSPGGKICRVVGTVAFTNSIINGKVDISTENFSAGNNCNPSDWSSYGSGNITTAPNLTAGGYLRSGSPCINAGSNINFVSTDIDGVPRVAGSVDMGCQEFVDTDGDGIPDNMEVAAGLNPNSNADAAGDVDNDGVSNLNEYLSGTNISAQDTDGDGIADNTELSQGLDPLRTTKFIYVATNGSDSNNGLTASAAKLTLKAAIELAKDRAYEYVIMVAPGTYSGSGNRNLDFEGYCIKLRSSAGAATTIIDLGNSGLLLNLYRGEIPACELNGFTVLNGSGYDAAAIRLYRSGIEIRNCVFRNNSSDNSVISADNCSWLKIENVSFNNNYASSRSGAALSVSGIDSFVECSNVVFVGNTSPYSGGAVYLGSASGRFSKTRFIDNRSNGNGGAIYVDGTSRNVAFENCLFNGNRALDGYADIASSSHTEKVWQIANITAINSYSASGSCQFYGTTTIVNSIIQSGVFAPNLTANNNCVTGNWSSYGSGNITASPLLTSAGYLTAGSPCINAGTSVGAPTDDIDGVARPWGNGIDIGCQEFKDSDSDGIPDNVEIAAGLNPNNASDAALDKDGDGISNLDEYLNGGNINSTDGDGDGIPDATEVAQGYDPSRFTNLVYVDGVNGDDNNSGASLAQAKRTIGAAVQVAKVPAAENVILVAAGTYAGSGNRNLSFGGFDIKLRSVSGASSTIIDLENAGRFLTLENRESLNSLLEGFTIRNGVNGNGSAVLVKSNSNITIKNCAFKDNRASSEGTVYITEGSNVKISNCDFIDNTASCGGGIRANGGSIEIAESLFRGNSSSSHGGAVSLLGGTNGKILRSQFINNQARYDGGAINIEHDETVARIENCLFNHNWSREYNADIIGHATGQHITIINSTFVNGRAKDNTSCYFYGATTVQNNIFAGGSITKNGNSTFVANNNCVNADWSSYGTGNISTATPGLTPGGYPITGSPCINAGLATNAPAVDLAGIPRPTGNGIDMGCYEFKDSDGDGIPDAFELAAGLNPNNASDAQLDADGDGISNLQEFLKGTAIASADTDGDGIADNAEIAMGYNPLVRTRLIYVDVNRPNDDGDGLAEQTAKKSIKAGVNAAKTGYENVVIVKPGVYSGGDNRGINFDGYNILLKSSAGARQTTIDMTDAYGFLTLHNGESKELSRLEGFTVANGNGSGSIIEVYSASLTIKNCRFAKHGNIIENRDEYYYWDWDDGFGWGALIFVDSGHVDMTQCEFEDNNFEQGNGLISLYDATMTMDRTKMAGNDSGFSRMITVNYYSTLNMTNCLVIRNNVKSSGNMIRIEEEASLNAVNCTFAQNTNGVIDAFSNSGTATFLNTILRERINGGTRSINYCCTLDDCSSFGSNNITADPLLSRGGMLMPGSPCIDAGTANGAPNIDIVGSARPFGNGIDIGSEEFADNDNDGISDYYEAVCGGNLVPGDDIDNDGLTNLQEYLLGTDASKADTDGDGMSDGWEASNNLDPLRNDARGDADGDGLLNIEEYEHGTNPNATDTDGDGRSDYWEVKEAFSDPTVVDFDGNETLVATINGNSFTNSSGSWQAENTCAYINDRSGWVEYNLSVSNQGIYQLGLEVAQRQSNAATDTFNISCYIDGALCSTQAIKVGSNNTGSGRYFLPRLTVGNHTVRLVWSNVYRNTRLQVNNLKLYSLSGPDTNNNGVPDWVESRLENMSAIVIPATSKVSPLCVEGGNAAFVEQIDISGYYVPSGETPVPPAVNRASFNHWYANVPLNPEGNNTITVNVSYQNGANTVTQAVAWEVTDVSTQGNLIIRKDDSLRLGATLTEGYSGTYTLTVENQSYEMNAGESMTYKFENAGDIPVTVTWTPTVGAPETRTTTIRVRAAAFNGNPICYVRSQRDWHNQNVGENIYVEADRNIEFIDQGIRGDSRVFTLKGDSLGYGYVTARLYAGGPIITTATMRVIDATTHVNDGYHNILTDFGDGTALYDGYVVVDHVEPGMQIYVTLWGSNTLFEDGTREKWFDASQFNSNGELHYTIIGGSNFTTCQSVYLYQDGVFIRQLQ